MTSFRQGPGSTALMYAPPAVISQVSQTVNNKAYESQQDSGSGEKENAKESGGISEKGKRMERDSGGEGDPSREGDHGSGHPGNSYSGDQGGDDDGPGGGPDDPEAKMREKMDDADVNFKITLKINACGEALQEIITEGQLIFRVRS